VRRLLPFAQSIALSASFVGDAFYSVVAVAALDCNGVVWRRCDACGQCRK